MKLGPDGKWIRPDKSRSRKPDKRAERREVWYARRQPKTVSYAAKATR